MLTRAEIVAGLRELGLTAGDRVMVHSSLSALGQVDGGAETVIDALIEAVGPEGLVAVPTFVCQPPFDRKTSATGLGVIADRFWRRPEAVRSLHPTHSVAAIGKGAEELIRDHEKAPTAYGEGTPYHKLAFSGGKILLLGVDQDRNTTLHTAEALSHAPYLVDIQATYIDDAGKEVTIDIAAMAGPHRDFIGLDPLFREKGIVKVGRIGRAVCRLIEAGPMVETALEAMRKDPALMLCGNPSCADCVMQRGKIKAAALRREDFTLAVVAGEISDDLCEVLEAIRGEGISAIEVTHDEYRRFNSQLEHHGIRVAAIRAEDEHDDQGSLTLAKELGVPCIFPASDQAAFQYATELARSSGARVLIENSGARSSLYADLYKANPDAPGLALNPAQFAVLEEKPFLEVFYRGVIRRHTEHLYIDDATFDGEPTVAGMGNGEIKEIISILRCRGFDGVMTIRSHERGIPAFRDAACAFWWLLESM